MDTRTAAERDKSISDYQKAQVKQLEQDFDTARRDWIDFSDEAHAELASMLAKADWRVARGPDLKKRLPKGALRPGGDCWNDIAEALQTFQSNRWITASDIAAAAGDGSYSNAQVGTVLGRMAEFNIVTTSGSRRSKKYCVTDQWLRDVR